MRRPLAHPTERLVSATRFRLFVVTLGLLVLLVVGIGAATAVVGLRALDADVDRALDAAVVAAQSRAESGLPTSEDQADDEITPAGSDTVLLYLDASGAVIADPSRVVLTGLPNGAAVAAARTGQRDLRTVRAGGFSIRLETVKATTSADESGAKGPAFIQAGFILDLHDKQSGSLVAAIVLVGAVGLVGAALVTLLVTGRALVPIRRSFEAQRRFVADASHELRTPAALIRANAEVLEREDLVEDDGRPFVADIIGEADRLARLVADLLSLASTDATGLALDRRPLDLADLTRETVRGATALASERGIHLHVAATAPAPILGDRDRLVQLLLILIENALDHSPPGGSVRVEVHGSGDEVALIVMDEGPGIPASDRERIFESFTRLPGVKRERAGGTGLGLAIGQRLVVAHGGSIAVDDSPDGGARFTVRLPASRGSRPRG